MKFALLSKIVIRALLLLVVSGFLVQEVSSPLASGQVLGKLPVPSRQVLPHGFNSSYSQKTRVSGSVDPPRQAVLLKNGSLFLGKVTRAKNLIQVEVGEKATLVFASKQIAIVADSVDQLYEIRSQHLKSWDLKGRRALLGWCLREKLFSQAAIELDRIQKHTIIKKSELDQLQIRLAESKRMHLETLELAKKAKLRNSRQANRPEGAIKKMAHRQDSNPPSRKKKPVIQSVFNIYDGTGQNPKNKPSGIESVNRSGNGLQAVPKPKVKRKHGSVNRTELSPDSSKPAKLKDFQIEGPEKKKTVQSVETEFFMRPKPDPSRPYDPEVFNRFYHPERFAKKTPPPTINSNRQSSLAPVRSSKAEDDIRPAFLQTSSLFNEDHQGKASPKKMKKE